MKTLGSRFLLAAFLAGGIFQLPAVDQSLYLITGPTDQGMLDPVNLFGIGTPGTPLSLVRTISENDRAARTCAVSIDPKERVVSVLVDPDEGTGAEARVVDMDNPQVPEIVSIPYGTQPEMIRNCLSGFLVRTPDGRVVQAIELGPEYRLFHHPNHSPASASSLVGVQVWPIVTDPKVEQLPWSYYARIEISNVGFNHGAHDLPEVRVGPGGVLSVVALGPADLPYSVNKDILARVGVDDPGGLGAFSLEASTPEWLALRRTRDRKSVPDGIGLSYHDVLDKSSGTWQTFEVPGSESTLKNFGDWFATTVIEGDSHKESPGKNHRRSSPMRQRTRLGVTSLFMVDELFDMDGIYSPGILYLLNARTGQTYTIQTKEGDSEVLLIDGNVVYYRMNDSIFRAVIGQESVGKPALLATDSHVPDVHWAFLGPVNSPAKR